jgi:hypothetical protein
MFLIISYITLLNMLIGVLVQVIAETSDAEEAKNQMFQLNRALVEAFREADKSHDEQISQDEWCHMADNEKVRQTLVKLGVDEGQMTERLAQMEETLFGHREVGLTKRQTAKIKNVKTICYHEFEEKVKELRWDAPARALELETLKSVSAIETKKIKQQLEKIEEALRTIAARAKGSRFGGGRHQEGQSAPAGGGAPPPSGGTVGSADTTWYPKRTPKASSGPGAATSSSWMQDVPTEMLFHILKTRTPKG